jgi:hypothetical protein
MRCTHDWLSIIDRRILSHCKTDKSNKTQSHGKMALHPANSNDIDITEDCDGSWGKDVTRATCVVLALLPLSMSTFQTRIHQRYVM